MNNIAPAPDGTKKGSRIWVDGTFDLCHIANATYLLHAKMYGKKLIVGVHNDEEVEQHIGLPVFGEVDRYRLIESIKWVDEVVEDSPFITTTATLNQFDCDFAILTGNITITDEGNDRQEDLRMSSRIKQISYHPMINENEIAGRILLMNSSHHMSTKYIINFKDVIKTFCLDASCQHKSTNVTIFDPITNEFHKIVDGKVAGPNCKKIFVPEKWDLFTVEHLNALELAKNESNYLIVGIYSDEEINLEKGSNFPITNVLERTLAILSLKIVDEVIIGAPISLTSEFVDHINIDVIGLTNSNEKNHVQGIFCGTVTELIPDLDNFTDEIVDKLINQRLQYQQSFKNEHDDTIALCNSTPLNNNQP